jgi:nucleotide-binding universal stress UspA family protein
VRPFGFAATRLRPRRAVVTYVWRSLVRHSLEARMLEATPIALVHAFVGGLDATSAQAANARAKEGVELAAHFGLTAEARAVESAATPWRPLLRLAQDASAAVLVTGAGSGGPVTSALAGSVSAGVVHHATIPVLVVPAGVARPPASARPADDATVTSAG